MKDEHGIELTEEVKMARAAADEMEIIANSIEGCGNFILDWHTGRDNSVTLLLPEGFAIFMRNCLRMIGEGATGINISPIFPPGYATPKTPPPTHNETGWEKCKCGKCEARRRS